MDHEVELPTQEDKIAAAARELAEADRANQLHFRQDKGKEAAENRLGEARLHFEEIVAKAVLGVPSENRPDVVKRAAKAVEDEKAIHNSTVDAGNLIVGSLLNAISRLEEHPDTHGLNPDEGEIDAALDEEIAKLESQDR